MKIYVVKLLFKMEIKSENKKTKIKYCVADEKSD